MDSCVSEIAPKHWVVNMTNMLKKIKEPAVTASVCILKVRKTHRDIKAEDYTPRLIGLGPYHHWRPDLYEMELYKLIAAKKAAAENDEQAIHTLGRLVHGLTQRIIPQVRACYDRYLQVKDEELAWMMVIDTIFLLQFLKVFAYKEQESCWRDHKRLSYLVDSTQSAYHSISRDMMMLENQIPTTVLDHIVSDLNNHIIQEKALDVTQLLVDTCKKLTPFQHQGGNIDHTPSHLLDMLYHMIVRPNELPDDESKHEQQTSKDADAEAKADSGQRRSFLPQISLGGASAQLLGNIDPQAVHIKPVSLVAKLTRSLLPTIRSSCRGNPSSDDMDGGTVPEIEIPSVSELLDVGVKFCPTTTQGRPISSCISFDKRLRKFHLPVIDIDDNTQVMMRNLVAYEAAAIPGPLVLARYTELMNGIIDTAKDARVLREKGIIKSHLKSDKDIADMWNLMSRSIRLSPVDSVDMAIRGVNEYYATTKKVRFCRFAKAFMFCAWQTLMLLFLLLLLVLLFIQSFCEVYQCPRIVAANQGSGRL